jgi:hypothetical protein
MYNTLLIIFKCIAFWVLWNSKSSNGSHSITCGMIMYSWNAIRGMCLSVRLILTPATNHSTISFFGGKFMWTFTLSQYWGLFHLSAACLLCGAIEPESPCERISQGERRVLFVLGNIFDPAGTGPTGNTILCVFCNWFLLVAMLPKGDSWEWVELCEWCGMEV